MKKLMALVIASGALSANAATLDYGWEDGVGTILGAYNDTDLAFTNSSEVVRSGNYGLKIVDESTSNSGTPQGYLAWVNGLTDGDEVTAGFWAYDDVAGNPSARIWGHYTDDALDVDSYAGSAGGNSTYSDGNGWSYLEYTWTFDSAGGTRDGLMIETRFYDGSSAPETIYIDDLYVSSTGGYIASPVPVPAAVWLFGSGLLGLAGLRRKQKK